MMKYTEDELKEIFKDNSNCYVDSEGVAMAMNELQFIETMKRLNVLFIDKCPNCGCDDYHSSSNGCMNPKCANWLPF